MSNDDKVKRYNRSFIGLMVQCEDGEWSKYEEITLAHSTKYYDLWDKWYKEYKEVNLYKARLCSSLLVNVLLGAYLLLM